MHRGLTWRAIGIGLVASAFLGHWSQYAELIIHGTQITLTYPPIGGFFVFLCLWVLFNVLLRLISPRLALTSAELLVVYTMIVMASGIASIDLAQKLIPMIAGPFYYASPANHWEELFLPHIPPWMAPSDAAAVKGLYEGSPAGVPWQAWLVPLAAWTAFTIVTYVLMLCLVTAFRRQWILRERLLFPLAAVPLEVITAPPRGRLLNDFFRNWLMWVGFVFAFALHFYNGLHAYFPTLPEIEVVRLGGKVVRTWGWGRPWNAIGNIRFAFMPLIIGLSFLLTREVSFSLWAFYWLGRAEAVLGTALGLGGLTTAAGGDRFPFPGHQTAGAYLALTAVSFWIARRPLAQMLRHATRAASAPDDASEALPYPVVLWGGALCFVLLVGWCSLAGMPATVAIVLLLVAFAYLFAMTRLVSEGGMPWMDEPHWRAHDIIRALFPFRSMSMRGWTAVGMLLAFTHDMRVCPMPRIMQSLKIADVCRVRDRELTWAIALATAVTIPISYWALIQAGYVHGGVAINTYRFVNLARQIGLYMERVHSAALDHVDWASVGLVSYGAAKLLVLSFLRLRYLWWPLHPVGYAMCYIVYLAREWLSVFIGWLCQTVLLRYGGMTAFRRYRPFFLGMIMGSMVVAGVWLIIDGITGLRDHKILY